MSGKCTMTFVAIQYKNGNAMKNIIPVQLENMPKLGVKTYFHSYHTSLYHTFVYKYCLHLSSY